LTGTQVAWGAQDVSTHDIGPYTGEVSVTMLRDFGCRYTIVGHSERRMNHGETDQIVAEKARRALSNGIHPIICVGETLTQRESGQTADVVGGQLSVLEPDDLWNIVIAYEPVWAIGTGKTATPQMAQEVHALLRSKVAARNAAAANSVPILYGGSLRPDNAREMLSMHDIDGGLVGGASLNASDFMAIANAVS
jgi:triosephosphate isomerase